MSHASAAAILTTTVVAHELGCRVWQLRRLDACGLIAPPQRVGPYRVYRPEDLPIIRAALVARGYLKEGETASAD